MGERSSRLPGGIRIRTTATATAIVGIALAVGAFLLLALLTNHLSDSLDEIIESQAADRARLLDAGADPTSLVATRQDESIVWIGTADGDQLAAGGSYRLATPLPDLTVGAARTMNVLLDEVEDEPDEDEAPEQERAEISLAVAESTDGTLVAVGAELESVSDTTAEVRNLLLLGLPFILAAVAVVTWRATGRTLAPVDQIRTTAEAIGNDSTDQRVPVPRTHDEIQRLAVTMNAMLERIEAGHLTQRRFTSDASHELKSPVANLRTLAETADITDPAWPETRSRLVTEADRLARVVDDLLFLAVADEAGLSPTRAEVVHVDDIVFDEAEVLAATTNAMVDIDQVTPCDTTGNPDQLRRLVRNLADNAGRHAATVVRFSCAGDGDTALIEVSDDGPGIPLDERETIFDRFARADSSRDRASGGTGLGLAIARTIAEGHGGTVTVADGPETSFLVRLPAAP